MTPAQRANRDDYPEHLRGHIENGKVRVMPDYHSGRDDMEDER